MKRSTLYIVFLLDFNLITVYSDEWVNVSLSATILWRGSLKKNEGSNIPFPYISITIFIPVCHPYPGPSELFLHEIITSLNLITLLAYLVHPPFFYAKSISLQNKCFKHFSLIISTRRAIVEIQGIGVPVFSLCIVHKYVIYQQFNVSYIKFHTFSKDNVSRGINFQIFFLYI